MLAEMYRSVLTLRHRKEHRIISEMPQPCFLGIDVGCGTSVIEGERVPFAIARYQMGKQWSSGLWIGVDPYLRQEKQVA